MNVKENSSRRRIEKIERIKESLKDECIRSWLIGVLGIRDDKTKTDAVNNCIDSLVKDIRNKNYSLHEFYKSIAIYREKFTGKERFVLTHYAEQTGYDAIELEELQSKERSYRIELEMIAEGGYMVNELYILSYPDSSEIKPEKWLITEFGVYGKGEIRPVHGCKMKKDGTPSRKAQYILTNHLVEYPLKIVNDNKKLFRSQTGTP
jgi:hypothetical protein